MAKRAVWLKQKGESQKAYKAFTVYREFGPNRSLSQVGRVLGNSRTWMGVWSSKFKWVMRSELWDEEQERIRLESFADASRAMGRRHADMADKGLRIVVRELERLEAEGLEDASLNELARMADVFSKIGLLARGQPTTRAELSATVVSQAASLEDLSTEDLKKIIRGEGPSEPPPAT